MFFWKSRTQSDPKPKRKRESRPNVEGLEERVVLQGGSGSQVFDLARLRQQAIAEARMGLRNSVSQLGVRNFTNFTRQLNNLQSTYQRQLQNFERQLTNNSNNLARQLAARYGGLAQQFDARALRNNVATSFDTSRLGQQFARQAELANNRLQRQVDVFRNNFQRNLGGLQRTALSAGTPYALAFNEFNTAFSTNFDEFNNGLRNTSTTLFDRLNTANTGLSTAFNNAVIDFGSANNPVGQFFASLSADDGELGRFQRDFTSNLNTFSESARAGFTNLTSTTGSINDNFYTSLNDFYFTPSPATGGGFGGGGFGGGGFGGFNTSPGSTFAISTNRF